MNPDGSQFSMGWGRFWFVVTWVAYCGVAFLLYRRAALSHSGFSEIAGFIVLPSLAWLGYFISLAGSPYLRPRSIYRTRLDAFTTTLISMLWPCASSAATHSTHVFVAMIRWLITRRCVGARVSVRLMRSTAGPAKAQCQFASISVAGIVAHYVVLHSILGVRTIATSILSCNNALASNQSMKPTGPLQNKFRIFCDKFWMK